MGPGRTVRPLPHWEQPRQASPRDMARRQGRAPCCSGGSSLGSEPIFFAFDAFPFLPVMGEACSAWASLPRPVCSQEGLCWALVGTQTAYSFSSRVLAPSLTLSVTLSSLWGRNKEPLDPGDAEEFRGQAPAGLPGRNTESLCDLKRLPNPIGKEHTMETPSPSRRSPSSAGPHPG